MSKSQLALVTNIRDNKLLKKFGTHLRKLRQSQNLAMEDVANKADIELSQVFRIEKGLVNPSLSTISSLAKALGVSLKDLVDF